MKLFSVTLGTKEFEVIGIADILNKTATFQGLVNGVPFTESQDYEEVSALVMKAVEINRPQKRGN